MIKQTLYYRYLLRQSLLLLIFSFVIPTILDIVLFVVNGVTTNQIWVFLVAILIWLFPLYTLSFVIYYLCKFLQNKKQLQNLELYSLIKNESIRKAIVNSGTRLKVLSFKQNQFSDFSNTINPIIDKQKEILKIKKGHIK